MSIQRFITGKRFVWGEASYVVVRVLPDNRINIENLRDGDVMAVPLAELADALFAGQLYFAVKDEATIKKEILTHFAYTDIGDCSPRLQAIVRYRFWVIEPLVRRGNKRTKADVVARVEEVRNMVAQGRVPVTLTYGRTNEHTIRTNLSKPSVDRWIHAYINSGYDIRALIPQSEKQGGQGRSYLPDTAESILKATIDELYLRREKATIDDVHAEVFLRIKEENQRRDPDEQLEPPARRTVARRIEQLGLRDKFQARHGKRAADFEFSQFGEAPIPERPGMEMEIDHTRLDYIVIDPEDSLPLGRPTFTYALDRCSRHPQGYYLGFEPPSYLTVMHCLSHAIRPKGNVQAIYNTDHDWIAYGLPRVLIVDNGKEFIGRDLDDACLQLGVEIRRTPVKTPYFKAMVERSFETINTGAIHTLEGTTFSNILQKGDYDSLKTAVLTLPNLDQILHIFLLDIYAERYHKGLDGIPARRWEAFIEQGFSPRLPPNVADLDILLGRMERRKLLPYGVELFSLRYNDPGNSALALLRTRLNKIGDEELEQLNLPDRKVKVKYDPTDISRIFIYDPFEKRYLELAALASSYTAGLSLWKHKVIQNFLHRERQMVDIEGLAWAKRKIREIVSEAKKRSKVGSRARIARWETGGQPASQLRGDTAVSPPLLDTPADTPTPVPPAANLSDLKLTFTSDELEHDGWSFTYEDE
ncbi:MAG: transposase [Anaerolineae bacterium]|nr:transposase [Anaerolineae bacterium]